MAFALRTMADAAQTTFRLVGAIVFGLAIAATQYTASMAMHPRLFGAGTAGDVDDASLSAAVMAISLSLLLGTILLAFVDRRLRHERAHLAELRERFDREHQLMLTLQRSLLPGALPQFEGLRLSASYTPATHHHAVGGDFYDAFPLEDGTLAVTIGDAAGHGLASSVAMNVARQAFRSAFLDGARPVEALRRANRVLLRSDEPAFVTALVGTIDPQTLFFRYACAGHPTPMLVRSDGSLRELPGTGTGIPLGILPDHIAAEQSVRLPIDGLIALYTDGCVEFDRNIETGTEALAAAIRNAYANEHPAPAIDRALFGERDHDDDATVMTLRPDPTLARVELRLPAEPACAALVRTAMRRFLAASRLDANRAYDALVAVGEAVSNAIEHAYGGSSPETFAVTAERVDATLVVAVADYGRWREPPPSSPPGRGLALMRRLSDVAEIAGSADGTRVTLRFDEAAVLADAPLGFAATTRIAGA
jgi:anti-sigma regulatory factor (Ser/Thr protein kinase)